MLSEELKAGSVVSETSEIDFVEEIQNPELNKKSKGIIEDLKARGILETVRDGNKTLYYIHGKELTELVLEYKNTRDQKCFDEIYKYYVEFIPFHWSHNHLKYAYNEDYDEFVSDYHEKLVVAIVGFQKKYAKMRKFQYNVVTRVWDSIATKQEKSRKNGSPICTHFNDYFFQIIRNLYKTKAEERRSSKNYPGVFCMICQKRVGLIDNKHLKKHGITLAEYVEKYPYAPLSKTVHSLDCENQNGTQYKEIQAVKQTEPGQELEDLDYIKFLFPDKKDYLLTTMLYRGASMIEITKTLKISKEEIKQILLKRRNNEALHRYAESTIFGTGEASYYRPEN